MSCLWLIWAVIKPQLESCIQSPSSILWHCLWVLYPREREVIVSESHILLTLYPEVVGQTWSGPLWPVCPIPLWCSCFLQIQERSMPQANSIPPIAFLHLFSHSTKPFLCSTHSSNRKLKSFYQSELSFSSVPHLNHLDGLYLLLEFLSEA